MKKSNISKKLTSIMLVVMMLTAAFAFAAPMKAEAAAKISKTKLSVQVKKTKKLKITGAASGATVTWASSNKKIATVNKKGKVKGVAKGTATITATVKEGSSSTSLKCTVTVTAAAASSNSVTEGFENEMDMINFYGSGSCIVKVTPSTTAAPAKSGKNFLKISGRSDAWQGPQFTLFEKGGACVGEAGKTYKLSVWVRSDVIDGEIKMTANVNNGKEYKEIAEAVLVKKGVWTKIEGEYTVPKNAEMVRPYVELLVVTTDFSIDDFTVTEVK